MENKFSTLTFGKTTSIRSSKMAIQFRIKTPNNMGVEGSIGRWIPKSLIIKSTDKTVEVPFWFASKNLNGCNLADGRTFLKMSSHWYN